MKRIDIYIKVEADLEDEERERRCAEELCRVLCKVYGVRRAEVSNVVAAAS